MFPSKACGVDSHLLRSPAIHTQGFSFQHVDMSVFQSPFWISFKRQKSFNVSSSCSTKQIYFNFSRSQSSVSRVSGSLESHLRSLLDELLNCKGKKYYFLDFPLNQGNLREIFQIQTGWKSWRHKYSERQLCKVVVIGNVFIARPLANLLYSLVAQGRKLFCEEMLVLKR